MDSDKFIVSDDLSVFDFDIKAPDERADVENKTHHREKQSENIGLLLYPDNEDHSKAFVSILKRYDYTYILHDRDVFENEDDELQKKPHWHILLHFSSKRTPSRLAKIFNIDPRFVVPVTAPQSFIRYMLHIDDKEKFQYTVEDIWSNRRIIVLDALRHAKTRSERAYDLLNLIIQNKNCKSYGQLWCFIIQQGYFDEANKLKSVIRDLWIEKCYYSNIIYAHIGGCDNFKNL